MGIKTRKRRLGVALLASGALVVALPTAPGAVDRPATPGSLQSVFASAQAGDTILLEPGNYGVFRGGMKSGKVTLQAQPGAAVTMALSFMPAANITIDGVTIEEIEIGDGATKNIVVRNSDVPGQTTMRTDELQNANIVFDHNVHRDWNKTDACRCGEGRISLQGQGSEPSGVTIQNSEFRGGMSDGIQNGSKGTKIIRNTFHDLVAGTPDGVHTDAIQLYGSSDTLIKGNYFHDIGASQIMAPDGADHETIEDNVFGPGDYPFEITLWSDNGSVIRHNTMSPGACWFNLACGIITLGHKSSCRYASECDPGTGTVVEDNIIADISIGDGNATFTSRSNLLNDGRAHGPKDLVGKPLFAGGARPTTYEGFQLAPSSPGRGNATDGLDRGIRVGAGIGGPPPSTTTPAARSTIRVLSRLRTIRRTGKLRLRVQTVVGGVIAVSGSVRPGRAVRSATGAHSRRTITLRRVSLGYRAAGSRIVTMKVAPRARRILGRSRNARLTVRLAVGSVITSAKLTIKR